jgi:hypothetical protein
MSAIDDKIQATKFILSTAKSFDQVRAAGLEAAAAASGGLTKVLENQVDSEASIQYMVKRGGFLDVMHFGLVFSGTAEGPANTSPARRPSSSSRLDPRSQRATSRSRSFPTMSGLHCPDKAVPSQSI